MAAHKGWQSKCPYYDNHGYTILYRTHRIWQKTSTAHLLYAATIFQPHWITWCVIAECMVMPCYDICSNLHSCYTLLIKQYDPMLFGENTTVKSPVTTASVPEGCKRGITYFSTAPNCSTQQVPPTVAACYPPWFAIHHYLAQQRLTSVWPKSATNSSSLILVFPIICWSFCS